MSDELLIKCGSPTLAGLKTGNMFSYPYESREEVRNDLRRLNKILVPMGLRVLPLRYSDKTVLLYLYRIEDLKKDLFIRGFLITSKKFDNTDEFPFYGNWLVEEHKGFYFMAHSLTGMHIYEDADGRMFFLLGHAYDPFIMEIDENRILAHIASAFGTEEYEDRIAEITGVFVFGSLVDGSLKYIVDPSGMQSAYFPPFKMFFLMTALSLIVQGGVNVKGINYFEKSRQEIGKTNDGYRAQKDESEEEKRVGRAVYSSFDRMADKMADYQQNYPNLFSLVLLLLSSGYLYFFFRKSPHIPDLRFSEFIVALVYVTNIVSLFSIVCDVLCIGWGWQVPLMGMMWIVPMCQLSGFSWWKVSLILIVGIVLAFMSFFAIGLAFAVWMLK